MRQQNMNSQNQFQQQENQHFFQEYTFKKIAACDVCREFLRGKHSHPEILIVYSTGWLIRLAD